MDGEVTTRFEDGSSLTLAVVQPPQAEVLLLSVYRRARAQGYTPLEAYHHARYLAKRQWVYLGPEVSF